MFYQNTPPFKATFYKKDFTYICIKKAHLTKSTCRIKRRGYLIFNYC